MSASPLTLLGVDAAVVLLRRCSDDLESSAASARTLVADMQWDSDAVRHVHEKIEAIDQGLQTLAAFAENAIADVLEDERRRLELLAMFAS